LKYVLEEGYSKYVSGTYIHPDLINSVTTWLCPKYQLKVNRIMNLINEKNQLTNQTHDDTLNQLQEELNQLKFKLKSRDDYIETLEKNNNFSISDIMNND
jgi:SLT domain-containing protein